MRPAFEDPARGDRAAALLAVVGVVNVPIVHFSVVWWNSLHQGPPCYTGVPHAGQHAVATAGDVVRIHLFYGAVLCIRVQGELLIRERQAAWVREAIKS